MTSSLLTRNKTQLGRTINHKVFWLVFHLLFGFLYLYSNNTLCVCFFMSFVNVFEEHNGWWIQKKRLHFSLLFGSVFMFVCKLHCNRDSTFKDPNQ